MSNVIIKNWSTGTGWGQVNYRTIEKFLYFPKCINDEIRWWKIARWQEHWNSNTFDGGIYSGWEADKWVK